MSNQLRQIGAALVRTKFSSPGGCNPILLIAIVVCVVSGIGAGEALGGVVYDNGAFNPSNGNASFSEGTLREADDFSLPSASTLRSTQFWGTHWNTGTIPAVEDFTVMIYGDAGGTVDTGNVLGVSALSLISRVDTGHDHNDLSGANILEYSMDFVAPIFLTPGTYWFSVYLATDAPGTNFAWQETGDDGAGNARISFNSGSTWGTLSSDLAFNLSDVALAVPEPGTALLMCLGLMGLSMARDPS